MSALFRRPPGKKGVVVVLLAAAVVCGGLLYMIAREHSLNTRLAGTVAALRGQQTKLEETRERLEKALKDTQAELETANTHNYRVEMLEMQDAFKEANQNLNKFIRERAELENTNLILESRLENTTKELTRTIDDLRLAQQTLGGVENPYRAKMAQLSENLKNKEQEYMNLQGRLDEAQRALMAYQAQGEDYSQGARKYQERLEVLNQNIVTLKKELAQKNRLLVQKEAALAELEGERETARSAVPRQEAATKSLESDRRAVEAQIFELNLELSAQQETAAALQRDLADARGKLSEREQVLAQKERALSEGQVEMDRLKDEMAALRSGKEMLSESAQDVKKVRRDLDRKIRDLEKENASLEKRLAETQARLGSRRGGEDPFKDRNLRLMTEQLVKKEEEIQALSEEVAALTKEKKGWEKSFGPREKHMAELEILVKALTKQLGDYASMLEKRDAELNSRAKEIASLTEDLEAQKAAALAVQKELAESRARQEQTLQKLTQLMSMNTEGVGPDDMKFDLYEPASGRAADRQKEGSSADARRRAEQAKRQVEVLMERR